MLRVMMTMMAGGAMAAPAERVIAPDGIAAATVQQTKVTLRIDPAAPSIPLLTSVAATRAGLKGGFFGLNFLVGRDRVHGRSAVGGIDLGTGAIKRRIGWADRGYAAAVDGVVGPGGLPEPVVRFQLNASRAGERIVTLPMLDQGGLGAHWGVLYARIEVEGEPMRVSFDPHHRRTLATAGAAVRIAAAQGGQLSGAATPVEIAFGIERPVRRMTLARPLALGPLALSDIGVRTSDFGDARTIPEADADPDEIVVTGRKKRDTSRDRLTIGADDLARCSSIVFDKPRHTISLSCG